MPLDTGGTNEGHSDDRNIKKTQYDFLYALKDSNTWPPGHTALVNETREIDESNLAEINYPSVLVEKKVYPFHQQEMEEVLLADRLAVQYVAIHMRKVDGFRRINTDAVTEFKFSRKNRDRKLAPEFRNPPRGLQGLFALSTLFCDAVHDHKTLMMLKLLVQADGVPAYFESLQALKDCDRSQFCHYADTLTLSEAILSGDRNKFPVSSMHDNIPKP